MGCWVQQSQQYAFCASAQTNGFKNVETGCHLTPPWWHSREILLAEAGLVLLIPVAIWRWNVHTLMLQNSRLEKIINQRTSELEKEKAELLKIRAALEEQVSHDPLTGLLNRSAIFYQLTLEMERAAREKKPLAVVLADLDYFKEINDTYGHVTGDCALREYAQRLHSVIRPYDAVGRYGGEEFLVLLPGIPAEDLKHRVTAMHQRAFAEPFLCNGKEIRVTASFGVAWYLPEKDDVKSLIERADQALYLAKGNGRNRIEIGCDASNSRSLGQMPFSA